MAKKKTEPVFDINAPATEFPCFVCGNDVGTEHFCYGCRVFICELCEAVYETTGRELVGKHRAEDHVTKEYLMFLVNRKR